MTFIERLPEDDLSIVRRAVEEAIAAGHVKSVPDFQIGRSIRWSGRRFCEIIIPEIRSRMFCEEVIYLHAARNRQRATIQVGCFDGGVFTTPPVTGREVAALVIDAGRRQTVSPFSYEEDYNTEA